MSLKGKAAVTAAVLMVAGTATAQSQKVTGPVADYWVSAATTSGFGAGMMGGGQRPSVMGMMRGAMNPDTVSKTLTLQLGSRQAAAGGPQAEHLPPASLGAGASLPLLSPQRAPVRETYEDPRPPEMRKPEGRMLIYWGCGDHAPANQPVVIDFAKIGQGQFPNLQTISPSTSSNRPLPATTRPTASGPTRRPAPPCPPAAR